TGIASLRCDQRQAAIAQVRQRLHQRLRGLDQDALDELTERALDGVLPARLHAQLFAHAGGRVQSVATQPFHRRALLLAERGVLQRLQRGQAAARFLGLLAYPRQLVLTGALLVLQVERRLLAGLQAFVEPVECRLLFLVAQRDVLERCRQRAQVERAARGQQLAAAAVGLGRLPVEIVHPGTLDIAAARGFALFPDVCFPALLPVGERFLGRAQRFLADLVTLAQGLQLRLGIGDRRLQHLQPRFVAAEMDADLLQREPGFLARLVQALRHLVLVGDLLLDPRQGPADLVVRGLGPAERGARLVAADAAGLQFALGLALFGDQLLQACFFLRQALAQGLQFGVQRAEL